MAVFNLYQKEIEYFVEQVTMIGFRVWKNKWRISIWLGLSAYLRKGQTKSMNKS